MSNTVATLSAAPLTIPLSSLSLPPPQRRQRLPLRHHHLQHLSQPVPLRPLPLLLLHQGAAQPLQPHAQVPHGQVGHLPVLLAG